jgi:small subunit ribosomal protein S5
MDDFKRSKREYSKYDSKTVDIRRVAKVTAGAKRLRFSAMVVAGDRKGSVGVGLGRGVDTRSAVEKGTRVAEKNMTKIEVIGDTIPHEVVMKTGAAKILLRPARPGTGVIAGPSARAVLELAGIENVYAKILGTSNLVANTYCTFEALKSLRKERVLLKMSKMRDRIGLKEEMDKERKKKEIAMRKKYKKTKNNFRKGKKDEVRTNTKKNK